jgi:hypothetical protein
MTHPHRAPELVCLQSKAPPAIRKIAEPTKTMRGHRRATPRLACEPFPRHLGGLALILSMTFLE